MIHPPPLLSPSPKAHPYTSPTTPNQVARPSKRAQADSNPDATSLIDRPFRHLALTLDAVDYPLERRLDDDPTDDHLGQGSMQRFEVEDEIELAHVLEQAIQGLDEDLDQVQQRQGRFGRGADQDEVEGRVVSVCDQRRGVVVVVVVVAYAVGLPLSLPLSLLLLGMRGGFVGQ